MNLSLHHALSSEYNQYYYFFSRYVTQKWGISDSQITEGIVSDSFAKVFLAEDRFLTDKSGIKAYLRVVVDETCNEYIPLPRKPSKILNSPNGVEKIIEAEFIDWIWIKINQLPLQRRRILKEIFLHGRTSKQVADEMGLSQQTVINQRVKALETVRLILFRDLRLPAIKKSRSGKRC